MRSSMRGTGSPGSVARPARYVAAISILGWLLAPRDGLDGGAEEVDLRARVVVVVLARDGLPANASSRATLSP